jgi:tRNA A64-2'-O-ribosylphosphate transferase
LVRGAEISEAGYIQGAGDDNEGWSQGLDPPIFWNNKEQLLSAAEQDLPDMIGQLLRRYQHADKFLLPTVIAPTDWLFIASSSALNENSMDHFTHIILCEKALDRVINPERAANCLHLHCREGKLGSRDLRKELMKVTEFLASMVPSERVLVSCHDGKDISVGVALAVLCQFADDNGKLLESIHQSSWMDKDFIRRRLSWIMTSLPSSKPLRTTLQSVNDFLLTTRK